MYGGMQEAGENGIMLWNATNRQTWAATAYVRMVLFGLAGMRFDEDGVRFEPCLVAGVSRLSLRNLHYRNMVLDLTIEDEGGTAVHCTVNGMKAQNAFVASEETGLLTVHIALK